MKKKFIGFMLVLSLSLLTAISVFAATSGWVTYNGTTARVYTDRSGDYPVSDTYVGITGEKSAGSASYYQVQITKIVNGTEYLKSYSSGQFAAGTTGLLKFYIDSFLPTGQSGTFKVRMKIFSDATHWDWIGDWETPTFTINN